MLLMVATLRTWSAAPNVNNLLLLQLTWIGDSVFPGGNGPANSVAVAAHGALGVKPPQQIGLFTKPLKLYGLPKDTLIFKGPEQYTP